MSSQVGTMVGGAFPEEAQVGQEIPSGPQAPSCEERNPALEQGKPRCI
jgi:hypothetical protein